MSPLLTALVSMRINALEEVLSDDIIFEVTVRHPKSVSTEEWDGLLNQIAVGLVEGAVEQIEQALGEHAATVAGGRGIPGRGDAVGSHMDTIEVRVRLTPGAVKGLLVGLRSMAAAGQVAE